MHRSTPHFRFSRSSIVALLLSTGCVGSLSSPEGATDDGPGDGPSLVVYAEGEIPVEDEATDDETFEEDTGAGLAVSPPVTVGELVDRRGCSTAPTMPLNAQIAQQMNCIEDGFFAGIDDIPNLSLGPGANPFLQGPAARALRRVAARSGSTFDLTNSWRSVVQQYVLDSWEGSCGIGVAAAPGRSNHESGLAIDVPLETTTAFRSALRSEGFRWFCDATAGGRSRGCRDVPHHDYTGGGVDLRSRSVLAFQQLWNRANPGDRISEDGDFGPATASRIRRSPLAGFPTGSTCGGAASCGDGSCADSESCSSCPDDCGACPTVPTCGDGSCSDGETCSSCAGDCGACPEGCDVEGHLGSGENDDPCSVPAESWRCVRSDHWDDFVSQVCRSGRWLTYEIGPRDCAACCGDYSVACRP